MNPLILISTIVGVICVIAALLRGGRFERLAALILVVNNIVQWAEQLMIGRFNPLHPGPSLTAHLIRAGLLFLAMAGLAWSRRARWLVLLALLCGAAFVDAALVWRHPEYRPTAYFIGFWLVLGRALVLLWAVIAYNLGPPVLAPGQAEFDRLRAALEAKR